MLIGDCCLSIKLSLNYQNKAVSLQRWNISCMWSTSNQKIALGKTYSARVSGGSNLCFQIHHPAEEIQGKIEEHLNETYSRESIERCTVNVDSRAFGL